jgi:hypothetical protein
VTAAARTVAHRRNSRQDALREASRLCGELACDVAPHPLLGGRFEAEWADGLMIGTAEELRASRRAQMLSWLTWFRAVGRER